MEGSCCLKKRKREEEAGQVEEQAHVLGLQEVAHPHLVDRSGAHHGSPLPPGWEQCLDLQSGQMYFMNPSTQARIAMMADSELQMNVSLPATSAGMPGTCFQEKLTANGMVRQQDDVHLNSSFSLNGLTLNFDASMAATVCLRCHTFVMVPQHSPHCPGCKSLCIVRALPSIPGNAQA